MVCMIEGNTPVDDHHIAFLKFIHALVGEIINLPETD